MTKEKSQNFVGWFKEKETPIQVALIGGLFTILGVLLGNLSNHLFSQISYEKDPQKVIARNLRIAEDSLGNYVLEITLENPNEKAILLKNLHIHYSKDELIECSSIIDFIYTLSDEIKLIGQNSEDINKWAGSVSESSSNLKIPIQGGYYYRCGVTKFYLDLPSSLELSESYSKIKLIIPHQINISKHNSIIDNVPYDDAVMDTSKSMRNLLRYEYKTYADEGIDLGLTDLKNTNKYGARTEAYIFIYADFDRSESISFSTRLYEFSNSYSINAPH